MPPDQTADQPAEPAQCTNLPECPVHPEASPYHTHAADAATSYPPPPPTSGRCQSKIAHESATVLQCLLTAGHAARLVVRADGEDFVDLATHRSGPGLSVRWTDGDDRIINGSRPEPQQADTAEVLDLVQQFGTEWAKAALSRRRNAHDEANAAIRRSQALLDRIAALVQQQPDSLVLSLPEGTVDAVVKAARRWYYEHGYKPGYLPRNLLGSDRDLKLAVEQLAPPREPRTDLPCGHLIESSKFENGDGERVLITVPSRKDENGDAITTPLAWCVQGHGWVSLTAAEYAEVTEVLDREAGTS